MLQQIITDQPVIEAEGFVLRPLRRSDESLILQNAGDERVARATSSIPHPLPIDEVRAFIQRAQAPDRIEDVWALDGNPSGPSDFMGIASLRRLGDNQSDISYWVAFDHWGGGVASRAVKALIAANPQKCRTLFASVFQDNPTSARVLTNCGFQYIGDAESFSVARHSLVSTWTYTLKCH